MREWAAFYGLDRRQARRLRRRVSKNPIDQPCNVPGCIMRLYNPATGKKHLVHFIRGRGPSL